MSTLKPRWKLETHDVVNQPPAFGNVNLYQADGLLKHSVSMAGGSCHSTHLSAFGEKAGLQHTVDLGIAANCNPPIFRPFDRWGHRIDEVDFHSSYHELMAIGLSGGVSSRAWTHPDGGHVAHAALLFMMSQAESGVTCPMSMTYASVPALRQNSALAADWMPRVLTADYDGRALPPDQKCAATIGMAMTEKQGGSDVRTNSTRAAPLGDGAYELVGHKWFCSAPMSDAFLTLAYAEGGLSCFLVPRWRPDGERNGIEIQRLKDKLGDKANASAEIEYKGAIAWRVGEEGRGVRTIVQMVNHTRLDCAVGAASLMRQSLSLSLRHVEGRTAFQRRLIDQPLMRQVLAEVAVEVEACMALAFRAAQAFDGAVAGDAGEAALARMLTPIAKYWVTKRCPTVVAETMEAHGGAGYIEEGLLPRIFRASPLNGIWEGSGNVIALDVLRAASRDREAGERLLQEIAGVRKLTPEADGAFNSVANGLKALPDEARARGLVERLAVLLAARTLQTWGREHIAVALLQARLSGSTTFGAAELTLDPARVLEDARLAA